MRFFAPAAALLSVQLAYAATILVTVGASNGLTYTPSSINASVGDVVAFQFQSKNHTVTQSTFANPCTQSGVDSGFQAVAANATSFPEWSITVNNVSAPLWFFCRQVGHCGKGMVFAINPTAAKPFDAFQAAALATASGTSASGGASGTTPSATSGGTTGSASPSTTAAAGNGAFLTRGNSAAFLTIAGFVGAALLL